MAGRTPTPGSAMAGFPEDGDPYEGADDLGDEGNPVDAPIAPQPPADPLADIRTEIASLRQENQNLRRLIPPPTPREPAPPPPPSDQPDYEKELFANPNATIAKIINTAVEKATTTLRAEYQKETGTQKFWNRFYQLHPDLQADSDLVEITLNSNLSTLSNLPIDDAYGKLADLTRERIMRYVGGKPRTPKARAEGGSGSPTGGGKLPQRQPAEQDEKVRSLSDFIRDRRKKRRGAAA